MKTFTPRAALVLLALGAMPAAAGPFPYPGELLTSIEALKVSARQGKEMPASLPGIATAVTAEAKRIWESNRAAFLDARPKDQVDSERIKGAGWLPVDDLLADPDGAKKLDPGKEYVLYCNGEHCWRSAGAALLLRHLGFTKLVWYREGLSGWKKQGLPTETADGGAPRPQASSRKGTIAGVVLFPGGAPMAGGKMVFFREGSGPPPDPGRYLRPPDDVVDIDGNGAFLATLPEGRYYLSAVRKSGGELIGPPAPGAAVVPGPAELKRGQRTYPVTPGGRTDIGTVSAVPFTKEFATSGGAVTAIEGTIRDEKGNPVAGAIAFAFRSPNVVGKPLFISERTGKDGRYSLRVAEGGTYYVKIRTSSRGGHPEEEEIIGVYGRDVPRPVSLATGEVAGGIDVQGRSFTNFRTDTKRIRKP